MRCNNLRKGKILMPTFSIIVPIYKTEKYLEKCIDSILKQTYEDFELIFSWGERVIPAFDGCDLLKDKKSKKYFSLEGNREKFIEILEKYEIIVRH